MRPNRRQTPGQVAGRPENAPQNSIRKNAGTRVYAPACKIPSRHAKLAVVAVPGPVQFYGTLAAPSLLARKSLTFASFLREPQVRDWVLAQNDSDAVAMMNEIQRDRACDKSPKDTSAYLKRLCRQRAAEKQQPIRYWQRVKNSLLHPYLGMLGGSAWNGKAENGEITRLDRHAAYRARERDRLAARRCAEGRAQELKRRIARLRRQAKSFDLTARAKLEKANRLLAAAKVLADKAEQKRISAATLSTSLKIQRRKTSGRAQVLDPSKLIAGPELH
jgi:hypothetical protein